MESDLDVDNPSSHDSGVRMNSWLKNGFFKITVRLDNDRDFSQQLKRCPSIVSAISWAAFEESKSEHLGARRIEGFVHDGPSN